jgi:hypothetical protein
MISSLLFPEQQKAKEIPPHFFIQQAIVNYLESVYRKPANNREDEFSGGRDLFSNYGKSDYFHSFALFCSRIASNFTVGSFSSGALTKWLKRFRIS